jgi:hypothetical protein
MTSPTASPQTAGGRFNKYASTYWKPEKVGDRITGTLVSVEEGVGQNGDVYPILTLVTEDGERRVRASQYDLKEKLNREEPADGDELEIELVDFQHVAMGKMKIFNDPLVVKRNGDGGGDPDPF